MTGVTYQRCLPGAKDVGKGGAAVGNHSHEPWRAMADGQEVGSLGVCHETVRWQLQGEKVQGVFGIRHCVMLRMCPL